MEDRVVCTCLDITYNTIKEAIENGAKTLDDISKIILNKRLWKMNCSSSIVFI